MFENLKIETYTLRELRQLYDDSRFWLSKELPFTRPRLQQYIANPFAEEGDPLWLMMREGSEICAYLGLIPDRVRVGDAWAKVFWLTSWWATPRYRGKHLAERLTDMGTASHPNIAINSGSPWTIKKLLASGKYQVYMLRPRTYWFLNINRSALREFRPNFRLPGLIYQPLHGSLSCLQNMRLRGRRKPANAADLTVEYGNCMDSECLEFIDRHTRKDFSIKTPESLSWRMQNAINHPRLEGVSARNLSYFGNVGAAVMSYPLKLFKGEKLIAVLHLLVTDGILRLPYMYLDSNFEGNFAAFIMQLCMTNQIDVIYSQNPHFKSIMDANRLPYLFCKSYPMEMLISKALWDVEKDLNLQDGDGAF
ncbi:MAG: hypothetical protein Q8J62_07840 [Candidatus Cloacimonadaceae bacterium]|nr:hypothetical protein [Candidatus Cloacimonadaceae bacterium]